jgi:hypothetical protein
MTDTEAGEPAPFGSLNPEAIEVVRTLMALSMAMEEQQQVLLYGRKLRRSYARDKMVRTMITEFGEGRLLTIADYQRLLADQASKNTVRADAMLLAELGVAVLEHTDDQPPAVRLRPTTRAVVAYNTALHSLRDGINKALQRLPGKGQDQNLV